MTKLIASVLSACLVLAATPTFAADCDSWQDIRADKFAPQAAQIASVTPPVVLQDLALAEGDQVVLTSRQGDADACIAFVTKEGGTVTGTVPFAALTLIKQPSLDWIGYWEADGEKYLNISDTDDGLSIVGDATLDTDGGTNAASFEVTARPRNGVVEFTQDKNGQAMPYSQDADGCSVRISIVGDYLVANDNSKCGGANVTFSGFYHKVAAP
ncbi:hypothetical protein WH87_03790 [Devosia epidermidihirudinis]|uniref:Uncharacterized protein n=1 Tax=Devosia epidermidihirudinis TaxID=1293439 RepID=A0A0F5QF52_9HYPH|nr:hypothetical protein [Devosia epidermidihirudinis]KKC39348.1 hypothetical protein WH87_03790 [Devosia epidermidihirudinis]